MLDLSFNAIVEDLNFTSTLYDKEHVLIVRHASIAHNFITRDLRAFEEYQRFQSKNHFGKYEYIIAFVGLPGRGKESTFAGIYRVLAQYCKGDAGFRLPEGDSEVVAACAGESFFYGLSRETRFDYLQYGWNIQWNQPETGRHQYLKQNSSLEVLQFIGSETLSQAKSLIIGQAVKANLTDEVSENSAGYSEGFQYYAAHLYRERDHRLVKLVKDAAKRSGRFYCEICKFDFQTRYGIDYVECHHTIPVSTLSPGDRTKIEDMVLLCANCHRAIHKRVPWLSKNELYKLLLHQ